MIIGAQFRQGTIMGKIVVEESEPVVVSQVFEVMWPVYVSVDKLGGKVVIVDVTFVDVTGADPETGIETGVDPTTPELEPGNAPLDD